MFLGLGAVALLVGGVGIANVMVISVLERRPEIGLRRALGARAVHIGAQFLGESVLLSALGGCVGDRARRGWRPPPMRRTRAGSSSCRSPSVGGAIAIALALGALAGLYPAIRAARLAPAAALRSV